MSPWLSVALVRALFQGHMQGAKVHIIPMSDNPDAILIVGVGPAQPSPINPARPC
jgi:hypothetical protein